MEPSSLPKIIKESHDSCSDSHNGRVMNRRILISLSKSFMSMASIAFVLGAGCGVEDVKETDNISPSEPDAILELNVQSPSYDEGDLHVTDATKESIWSDAAPRSPENSGAGKFERDDASLSDCDKLHSGLNSHGKAGSTMETFCTVKSAILWAPRPNFTGAAAQMNCGSGRSRNHFLSWESIRNGYYAVLNPSTGATCSGNLGLLYDAVGLTRNYGNINSACAQSNLNQNRVTTIDQTVLSDLNSSINNLRCGYSSPNQSLGAALDMPCGNQAYRNNRIEISGIAASRISAFLAIGTIAPQPFSFYKINQTCTGTGACSSTRLQTSDCSNDVGAGTLPPSNAPVVYWNIYINGWMYL